MGERSDRTKPPFEPVAGDTIVYPLNGPIIGIGRVVSVKGEGWYEVRRYDMPAVLNASSEDLRVDEPRDLRDFLPNHDQPPLKAGDYVLVATPAGMRLVTLVHDVSGNEPGLVVREYVFDFGAQQYIGQTITVNPKSIFTVASFVYAR